jgi:Transposase zinc-ribbon domain/ISXO2-like transposase domain
MQAEFTSFWEWQQHFSDEKRCLQALIKLRWPDGFVCGCCGHPKGWLLQTRHVYECARCHQHTSVTADTLFHNTKLPLVKWFWCIYWMSTDKGSISALRLTKLIGVSWIAAHRMLRKLRVAMGDQNRLYRLEGIIELDDAFAALRVLTEDDHHVAKVTPPELVDEWLPWVYIVISNFKSYVLGTYHGVSGRYMQEYLDEFCYRLNRRFWENQIPNRLLKLCATHPPVSLQPVAC